MPTQLLSLKVLVYVTPRTWGPPSHFCQNQKLCWRQLKFQRLWCKDVQRIKCPLTYLCIEVNSLYSKMSFDLTEEQIYVFTLKKCQWHKLIQQLWIQSCLEQSSTENRVQLKLVCVQSKLAPGTSPGLKLKLNLLLVEWWGEIVGRWSSLKSWVVSWVEN